MNIEQQVDQVLDHKKQTRKTIPTIEVIPNIHVKQREIEWFVSKIFNPELTFWVWIRRISNLLIFPIFIILVTEVLGLW